jgi:hypothetical protein
MADESQGLPPHKKSRYAKEGTISTMEESFGSTDEQKTRMTAAMRTVEASKVVVHSDGLTEIDMRTRSDIERFSCWTCSTAIRGISEKKSGGLYNKAIYFQVGANKSSKFQVHKLSLCVKENILYTALEQRGLETSHLCHNKACWRPTHLHAEDHAANVARNTGTGCGGWVFFRSTAQLLCLCRHVPCCMFLRVYESLDAHLVGPSP